MNQKTGLLKAGDERFALVRVTFKGSRATCTDLFNSATKVEANTSTLNRGSQVRSGEVLLVGNNGTQINFDRESRAGEWEHFLGFGAGPKLLGLPTPLFDLWEDFIDHCHFIDISSDEVWGLGKWKHQSRLKENAIVSRLREKHGGVKLKGEGGVH